MTDSRHASQVAETLRNDPVRWRLLGVVAELGLPDCWIAAGFVRNAVWDALHGWEPSPPAGDVDVIWYDPARLDPELDRTFEERLRNAEPGIDWSVKNQARMHARNGDAPYASATDAMRFWPETATAVAARRKPNGACEIAAPYGLEDLMSLTLRPTARFVSDKRPVFDQRVARKEWLEIWPKLTLAEL